MKQDFKGIQMYFWPVYKKEFKKVVLMCVLMACILFNYTILRDVKDTFLLGAPGCGAETMTFLKVWGTVPMAIFVMGIYAKLSLSLSKKQLFYTVLSFFVIFFGIFNYVLYPNIDVLHASSAWISKTCTQFPRIR